MQSTAVSYFTKKKMVVRSDIVLINLLRREITQEEYLINNNAKIIYKKLPKKVYGFIHRYREINLIVINWNISKQKKKEAILHEFAHLELQHLEKEIFEFCIENVEDEANRYIKFLLENKN